MSLRDIDFTPDPRDFEDFVVRPTAEELTPYRTPIDPDGEIRCISAYISEVVGELFLGVQEDRGDVLPWDRLGFVGFRPGEMTVWAGINGHGKSAITTQIALYWALQGRKSLIASFEMTPKATIKRMLFQAAGSPSPSEEFTRKFFRTLRGKVFLWTPTMRPRADTLIPVIRLCKRKLGIDHAWVDSLQKCVRGDADYDGQKNLVEDLSNLVRELMLHIHLVAHVKKLEDEFQKPGKFDAKGTSAISDLVDQYITVWRDKKRERAIANGEDDDGRPDFLLICDKNRHGGIEGRAGLWGDIESWHFRETRMQPWSRGYNLDAA
jgi:twinkle protein